MKFIKTTLDDVALLQNYFGLQDWRTTDYSPGSVLMWRDYLQTNHCEWGGFLIFKGVFFDGQPYFTYPVGNGDLKAALDEIERYAAEHNLPFNLYGVPEQPLEALRGIYGGRLSPEPDRAHWDYLYDAESMRTFAGKKLSAQRNHVNKFSRLYPDCRFVKLDESNIGRAKAFCEMYVAQRQNSINQAEHEGAASVELFSYLDRLGGKGGFLELDGQIIALSLGEQVGDTLFIHVEKALHEYPGIYQVIVKEFACAFADGSVRFINREEDDGVEGLRKSKLAYHPVKLLEKYNVRIAPAAAE